MPQPSAVESRPSFGRLGEVLPLFVLCVGLPVSVAVIVTYGRPYHALGSAVVMGLATGLGVTLGFHRLFTHRSFETYRPVEWLLMVLGCMAGQSAPFHWVANHRRHHQHSDSDGDPHSPYTRDGRPLSRWRGFWHAHIGWTLRKGGYEPGIVRDLAKRPDLAFIDRTWHWWYFLGLALPALFGWLVGGRAYDALAGFLWGGLYRHALTMQATYAVNSVSHIWGSHPFDTGDSSRNNWFVAVAALGEGWHNNHHAYPRSARHGFHWWQIDVTWYVLRLMETAGLAWKVQRPKLASAPVRAAAVAAEPVPEAVEA